MSEPILCVRDLTVRFGSLRALDKVSLDVFPGEILGLVGESGCGKTTLARTLLRLHRPQSGEILFRGAQREIQMIFQDPYAALDPRMTIGASIAEALYLAGRGGGNPARVRQAMELTGLDAALASRYPHELSGGQCQRAGIARALAAEPKFLVADEPISCLDVSIQAQILNLLRDLRDRMGLSYLFISHDLRAVESIADRVAVMYLGEIVEVAAAAELYARPLMPYTQALLAALPAPDPQRARRAAAVAGDVPSALHPPSGCRFRTRCPYAIADCAGAKPPLREVQPGHLVACIGEFVRAATNVPCPGPSAD